MKKIVRSTYPIEITVGMLLLIFVLSFLLSSQLFTIPWHDLSEGLHIYFAMFLISMAVIVMIIILWEQLFFPVRVKHIEGGETYRNHRNKLITQLLIYLAIPAIFGFVYSAYEVNQFRFVIWAAICTIVPVAAKLVSGLNNYNDFLTLTTEFISYKNNQLEGSFELSLIGQIEILRDSAGHMEKIKLHFKDSKELIIDLDEMELEDFYDSIEAFTNTKYQNILKA